MSGIVEATVYISLANLALQTLAAHTTQQITPYHYAQQIANLALQQTDTGSSLSVMLVNNICEDEFLQAPSMCLLLAECSSHTTKSNLTASTHHSLASREAEDMMQG